MSEKDKIYELFRQNEHKLAEKPSRRAWERVDARLDRHNAKLQSPVWLRYGGMVAAVMILVLTASLLVMNNGVVTNDNQVAFNDAEEKTAPQLLDFKDDGNIDNHLRIVAYQNEYKNRENRISESSIAGDLRPRGAKRTKRIAADKNEFDDAIALNDVVANDNRMEKPEMERMDVEALDENIEIVEVARNMVTVDMPKLMEEELLKEKKKEAAMEKEEAADEELAVEEVKSRTEAAVETLTTSGTTVEPAAIAVMPTAPGKGNANYEVDMTPEPMPAIAEEESSVGGVKYDVNADDGGFMEMKDEEAESLSLSDFDWLLGTWKGKVNGSVSKETWTKMSTTSYKGRGILTGGGTTLFMEKMELRITDVGTYLTISLGKKNKRVAYRMTSNNGYTIVFTNNSVDFPKKIILTKKSDETFSLVMQAGDTENLDNEQVNYLENRNVIEGAKMVRSLRKDD